MTDNETGLPELPEGYFWRVRYHETQRFGYYDYRTIVDKSKFQLQLLKTESYLKEGSEKRWFRTVKIKTPETYEKSVYVQDCEGTNPIAIRNAANRIMKKWNSFMAREALIGDYPPKKLELSDD